MISIPFEIEGFRDAIVLPDDHTLTDADIEAIKEQRYAAWLVAITPIEDPEAAE